MSDTPQAPPPLTREEYLRRMRPYTAMACGCPVESARAHRLRPAAVGYVLECPQYPVFTR